jgi:hypothetical protein
MGGALTACHKLRGRVIIHPVVIFCYSFTTTRWSQRGAGSACFASRPRLVHRTMPVYIRTTAGTAAALNPLAKLPRNLRQLLVAIDGSTPSSTYAARMASPGDIDVLLEVLQRAGLIRQAGPAGARHGDAAGDGPSVEPVDHAQAAVSPASPAPGSPSPTPEVAPPPLPSTGMVSRPVPFMLTDVHVVRADAEPEPIAVAAVVSAAAADRFDGFGAETAPADLRPAGAVYYELGNVISLMSDFVTRHLPERSLEIVLALEGLASIGQVLSSLDDYRALITPMGDVAHHHLAELQRMLDAA